MIEALRSGGYLKQDDAPDPYTVCTPGTSPAGTGSTISTRACLIDCTPTALQAYADMIRGSVDDPGFRQPARDMVDYFSDMGVTLWGKPEPRDCDYCATRLGIDVCPNCGSPA